MTPSDILDALTKYPRGAVACGLHTESGRVRYSTDGCVSYWLNPRQWNDVFSILGIVVEKADAMGVEALRRLGQWCIRSNEPRDPLYPTRLHALLAGIEASGGAVAEDKHGRPPLTDEEST